MKIRITFLSLLGVSAAIVASAQVAEYDDMYFNSKDRAVVMASKPLTLKNISSESYEVKTAINPTDSYSARNVNPEYISQSTVNPSGSVEKAPYFIPDYSPVAVNQNLNKNSNYSGNNSYPGMMPSYGSPYNSFYPSMYGYSPYGSGYNNGFNSMYGYNPYGYNSGWSSMLSLTFGMGSYCPWGGSSYYGNYYSPYNQMGMGYGGYYPNNVIVINNDYYNNVAYGKRSSRSSDLNNTINANNRSTTMITTDSQGRVRGSGGRVSSVDDTNSTSGNYYQSGWRTNPETNSAARSNWSSSGRSGSGSGSSNSGFFNNSGSPSRTSSSYDNSSSRTSNFGGGNSSSNFSSGGGSRSSGSAVGSGGSSSSSGARRGRD